MEEAVNGIANVLKPPGMTSHDVVRVARRVFPGKVGHTGTLDPMAAGVLVLTIGAGTKVSEFLTAEDKTYRAEIILGLETDTLDLEGQVVSQRSAAHVGEQDVRAALAQLTGELEMVPPMFSAVKQDGRKLYELARKGEDVERKTRRATVSRFDLLRFTPGEQPMCLCEVECSKGTYIRSLAEMLGARLECGACLGFLLRTAQGRHSVGESCTLEELESAGETGSAGEMVVPLSEALPDIPKVVLDESELVTVTHGGAVAYSGELTCGELALALFDGEAICLVTVEQTDGDKRLQPKKVFRQ